MDRHLPKISERAAAGLRVVIVGGGTVGLAAAWALARGGARTVVLERFAHIHDLGSHSGYTRVTRRAYHEGAAYIPLIVESEAAWEHLEGAPGGPGPGAILSRCGILEGGPAGDPNVQRMLAACVTHGIDHRICELGELRRDYGFELPPGSLAVHVPSGGFLRVAPALGSLRRAAAAAGASFREGAQAQVVELVAGGRELRVLLESGELIPCDRIVVAAGAYLQRLLPTRLRGLFAVRRRVLAWSTPTSAAADERLRRLPVWAFFTPEGLVYGFPAGDEGISGLKLALHTHHAASDPPGLRAEDVQRTVDAGDLEPLGEFLRRVLPGAAGPWAGAAVCLYQCTENGHFLVDLHPDDPRIAVVGGLSGHGFKMAPALGRLAAELVAGDRSRVPALFRWDAHRGVDKFA